LDAWQTEPFVLAGLVAVVSGLPWLWYFLFKRIWEEGKRFWEEGKRSEPVNDRGTAMNPRERNLLIGVAVATVLLLLFPPFCEHLGGGRSYNWGYSFLFKPPPCEGYCSVNVPLLLVELLATWVVGGILWVITSRRK
jgi:hypothetical protein